MSAHPYDPPELETTPAPAQPDKPRLPRVWPVFVVFVLVVVGAVAAQIPVTVVLVLIYFSQGGTPQKIGEDLPRWLAAPWPLMALAGSSQLVMGAAALIPAWFSPTPLRQRLGLVPSAWPAWSYLVLVIGAWAPALLGLALAWALTLVLSPDPTAAQLYEQMTWSAAAPFVLFIAVFPGFFEELLFRGYMQRRLLQRWPVWLAILTASSLFAALHVMPHTIVFACPLGVWLGIIAWRSGSVWPCIACHAFINGSWNVYQIGSRLGALPDPLPLPVLIAGGLLISSCFAASLWLFCRRQSQPEIQPEPAPAQV